MTDLEKISELYKKINCKIERSVSFIKPENISLMIYADDGTDCPIEGYFGAIEFWFDKDENFIGQGIYE